VRFLSSPSAVGRVRAYNIALLRYIHDTAVLIVLLLLVLIEPLRCMSVVYHLQWNKTEEDRRVLPPQHAAKLPREDEWRELWSNSKDPKKEPNYAVFLLTGSRVVRTSHF
jgi:hypothetical protein